MLVDFKGKNQVEILKAIIAAGHYLRVDAQGTWECSDVTACQAIVDNLEEPMPRLKPVNFHYMLAKFGFKPVIDPMLEALQQEDSEKYAKYYGYLTVANYYDFDVALDMFNDVKDKLVAISPDLDFTVEQLKQMWMIAKQV